MTTAQLITELEKRGVLTWEVGDIAVCGGTTFPVITVRTGSDNRTLLSLRNLSYEVDAENCTHSTDDPRLLGRVLRAVDNEECFSIHRHEPLHPGYSCDFNKATKEIAVDWDTVEGDTLLHAALLAWLAKVEGEQS